MQNVVFADIDEPRAQQAAEESKSYAKHPEYAALVVGVDVVDEASVQAMVDKTVEAFGRIDYCVNCAGVWLFDPLAHLILHGLLVKR